jgi:hypothetical protein
MPITAKILADSLAPSGKRLTTFVCTYPRAIHSELMTHRMLTKSSASSRAIPVEKLIQRIVDDPWIPSYIGANQKGMQAGEELREDKRQWAVDTWLRARDAAVEHARHMISYGVHKQVVNRLLEPWMFITVIITGTEWNNFFALRRHEAAEPHFHELADKMWEAREASTPDEMPTGGWHTPLFGSGRTGVAESWADSDEPSVLKRARDAFPDDIEAAAKYAEELMVKISVGRCARVSYLTHDGRRDIKEDIGLHDRLLSQKPMHAAPFEHVAMALDQPERHGNLVGWKSYRMTLPNESVPG